MDSEPEPPLHLDSPAGSWRIPLLAAALLGAGVLAGVLWLGRPGSGPTAPAVPARLPPLSAEAAAYLSQIEIGGPALSRWENFLGQRVTYLDIPVTNRGRRTVVALELTIEFHDPYRAVVLRETLRGIGGSQPSPPGRPTGPLGPGEARTVRASFEHIPADWNGLPPQVRVTALLLQ